MREHRGITNTPSRHRELGDVFAVKLKPHNRRGGFKALRERWKTHVASSRIRPVLLIDEAQEMSPEVLSELRILSSADFDATSLLSAYGMAHDVAQLDEKCYLEVFQPSHPRPVSRKTVKI